MSFLKNSLFLLLVGSILIVSSQIEAKFDAKQVKSIKKMPKRAVSLKEKTKVMQNLSHEQTRELEKKFKLLEERKALLRKLRKKYRKIQHKKNLCRKKHHSKWNKKIAWLKHKILVEQRKMQSQRRRLTLLLTSIKKIQEQIKKIEENLSTFQMLQTKYRHRLQTSQARCNAPQQNNKQKKQTQQQRHNTGQYKNQNDAARNR